MNTLKKTGSNQRSQTSAESSAAPMQTLRSLSLLISPNGKESQMIRDPQNESGQPPKSNHSLLGPCPITSKKFHKNVSVMSNTNGQSQKHLAICPRLLKAFLFTEFFYVTTEQRNVLRSIVNDDDSNIHTHCRITITAQNQSLL